MVGLIILALAVLVLIIDTEIKFKGKDNIDK